MVPNAVDLRFKCSRGIGLLMTWESVLWGWRAGGRFGLGKQEMQRKQVAETGPDPGSF